MRLIKTVEVGYFRSIYKESLQNLADMTIIFGRNDAGKSNFLRALNLFFNDCTNPERYFDFFLDFNHGRMHECSERADTRKFVYIKVVFDTPSSWEKSLGETFWVKKTWSVSRGNQYIVDSSIEKKNQQFLTRFLNKVQFHYIPAVKDRGIFESLLGQVYDVLSADETFYESLSGFTKELQDKTDEISRRLLHGLNIKSVIAPPEDLTDLFRSLDFETKNQHEDPYSLTLQKGDGVQARHIPVILSFLSDKSKRDYHVWGFEEPENSLELASACEEAKAFLDFSKSWNKQIFLTSHSPAFFSLEEESVKRYFVSKKIQDDRKKETSIAEEIKLGKEPADLMEETPLLPAVSSYLRVQAKKLNELEKATQSLKEEIEENSKPILFVEGESDKIIFERAWELFGNGIEIRIVPCSGTTKMKGLSQNGAVLRSLNSEALIFVLVDNDKEGRDLSNFSGKRFKGGGVWVDHNGNGSCWCRLPFSDEFTFFMKDLEIPEVSWPFTLENSFSTDLHKEAVDEGALYFECMPHKELLDCDKSRHAAVKYAPSEDHTYLRTPHKDYKIKFAEWIVEKSKKEEEILEIFRPLFVSLKERLV
ncbi:ATP-binding protein [Halomonas sp. EGI 63088]|uniref:ATP-binding protein n=1 Tax=Halomonas flagellata TaxID=2920385 RepID=A0ABS9RQH5_9GAMM|nr:AAA family ATPase [Halomonas flagellata]MCH4562067.1 ATP-binding protein [Halomonas flagellata]